MELLFSNFLPLKTSCRSFADAFYRLIPETTKLDIAVGYITSDSLVELKKMVELNDLPELNLTIGMHYWDLFTKVEYNTAIDLNNFLQNSHRGQVRLVTPFRFHGKLYSCSNQNGPFAGIIGSNNLSSIVEGGSHVYESSILLRDRSICVELYNFIQELNTKAASNIGDLEIIKFNEKNQLLEGHEHVEKKDDSYVEMIKKACTATTFEIPIKTYEESPQSNLNVFFGKGREAKNGLVKPRHWYEVELIVPKTVTSMPGYPKAKTASAIFDVVTDDGWYFKCKVSGDNSKNFRSEGDLKILGKWLKGRLENSGALKVGEPVTIDTLKKYGRYNFSLTKTDIPNCWYLDFGVRK